MSDFRIERNKLKSYSGSDSRVVIPDGVKSIDFWAFSSISGNSNIEELVVPGSVNIIKKTFNDCKDLKKVTILNGVSKIENHAFEDCESLKEIVIPESVLFIGYGIIENCNNIESIKLPFVGASEYEKTYLGHIFGCLTYNDHIFSVPKSLKTVTIKGHAKEIPDHSFQSCQNIEKIVLSEGIESIGNEAFSGCNGLKEIIIPESVKEIGRDAFSGCGDLTIHTYAASYAELFANSNNIKVKIIVDNESENSAVQKENTESFLDVCDSEVAYEVEKIDKVWKIEKNKKSCMLLNYKGDSEELVIPESYEGITIREIGRSQNQKNKGYNSIKRLVLPAALIDIQKYAFSCCSNLESIVFPDTVARIWDEAFANCISLKSIKLPDSVNRIWDNAFINCKRLESVEIGVGLELIGEFAFRGCEQLKEINIPKGVTHISRGLFRDCKSLEKIVLDNRREIDFRKANGFLTGAPKAKIYIHRDTVLKECPLKPNRIKYIEE